MTELVEKVQIVGPDGTPLAVNADGSIDVNGGGGGAPTDAQYYVGAASSGLSAEIVVPAFMQTLLDDTTAAAAWATLGLPAASPGYEIGYDQVTSVVSVTNGSSEGSPDTLITCASHTFDGDPVMVTFFAPSVTLAGNSGTVWGVGLYESGSEISRLTSWTFSNSAAINRQEITGVLRFTPSAGSHTYTVGGFKLSGTASGGGIGGGSGSGANYPPMFVRFTKA